MSQVYEGEKPDHALRLNNKNTHAMQSNDLYSSNRWLHVNVGKNGSSESIEYKTFT